MTRQRDPKTGRFISKGQAIAAEALINTAIATEVPTVTVPVFVRWPWQRCKTAACKLNKGHQGAHARPGGFGVQTW